MNAVIALLGGIRASVFAALMLVFAGLFAWKAHQATATAAQFRAYQDRMIALTATAREKAHQARDAFVSASLDNERAYQLLVLVSCGFGSCGKAVCPPPASLPALPPLPAERMAKPDYAQRLRDELFESAPTPTTTSAGSRPN